MNIRSDMIEEFMLRRLHAGVDHREETVQLKSEREFIHRSPVSIRIVLLLLFVVMALSQVYSQSLNDRIYHAYISAEMDEWFNTMTEMQSVWEITGSYDMLYDLVVAQYGYIAFSIAAGHDRVAREYVREAEDNLEILLDQFPEMARAHALLGAIYGFKVGLNPIKAVVFGTRAIKENARSMELDPDDPQIWMEKGNIQFFKPDLFGPDSREAARHYRKAVELFESNPKDTVKNWLYLNTLRNLADAYIDYGAYYKADETYRKILRVEPGLSWIRERDYPEFLEKYGGEVSRQPAVGSRQSAAV